MSLEPTNIRYVNQRQFLCSSLFYNKKICDGVEQLEPPKKAKIFSKPEHVMSKSELRKWLSRNKIR